MATYSCPTCQDIILIILPGDEVDELELITKIEIHESKYHLNDDELNRLLEG